MGRGGGGDYFFQKTAAEILYYRFAAMKSIRLSIVFKSLLIPHYM